METRSLPASVQASSPPKLEQLRLHPGDTLRAKVIALSGDTLMLQLGQRQLHAKLSAPNAQLQRALDQQGAFETNFRVVRNNPNLVLKIAVETPAQPVPPVAKFARATVPYQQALADVFKFLATSETLNADAKISKHTDATSKELAKLATVISNRLPSLTNLVSADGFKSALTQSGVLYESQLADWLMKNTARPGADLKARLLRVADELRASRLANGPKSDLQAQLRVFSGQIDSALARIETLQLASTEASNHDKNLLFFEIPYKSDRAVNVIRGFIKQRNQTAVDAPCAEMAIGLEIRLSEQDILLAKVTRSAQGLQVLLWSESPRIQQAIQAARATFEQHLCKRQPSSVHVSLRKMATDDFEPLRQFDDLLIDEA